MLGSPSGFEHVASASRVEIRHHGRHVTTLRDAAAEKFLDDIVQRDPQHVMARVTGNYRHGNERSAPRRR